MLYILNTYRRTLQYDIYNLEIISHKLLCFPSAI